MKLYLLLSTLIISHNFVLLAQRETQKTGIFPTKLVFEKFHSKMLFLDRCIDEIDTLERNLNNKKPDSLFLYTTLTSIQTSFQKFTRFNVRNLASITKNLASTVPIRGSEMTYLNKSFMVYKKYDQLLDLFQNIIKSLKENFKGKHPFYFNSLLLDTQLSSLNFFYRNYHNTMSNKRLRRILNSGDLTFDTKNNELKKIARKLLRKKQYKKLQKLALETPYYQTKDSSLFRHIQTTSYQKSIIRKNRNEIKNYFFQDQSHRIGFFFTHNLSKFIGNFAGIFRFRKGYLCNNDSIYLAIKKRLKPMDIIAEKTGFTLTDKLIPGYFGHIAIWLGTEKQLKELKLWEHPILIPFQNRIRHGYSILETDRKGTHLKTLKNFINVDEIAIASINHFEKLPVEEKAVLYKNALAQLGKEYDFNFDVETSDKLVCSELLYQVFGAIHWPTDSYLKRNTISPDNVLSLVLYKNSPISLSYHLGATSRKNIYTKNLDDLAKDLNYFRKKGQYVAKGKKCSMDINENKKKCRSVYYPLEY